MNRCRHPSRGHGSSQRASFRVIKRLRSGPNLLFTDADSADIQSYGLHISRYYSKHKNLTIHSLSRPSFSEHTRLPQPSKDVDLPIHPNDPLDHDFPESNDFIFGPLVLTRDLIHSLKEANSLYSLLYHLLLAQLMLEKRSHAVSVRTMSYPMVLIAGYRPFR